MHITAATAQELRLTPQEFELIVAKLGRTPNFNELCAFSAMWSEHCSYKNSIKWLKTLPRDGAKMLIKAGDENAGVMDIGDGLGVVFKIESHNHPSAIEPYQGAATGVGGIHRDIFTMGARPIAALNSLRFGNLNHAKTQHLLKGVVKGIGHYGNCFGVPTVGGEVYFDECYHTNPLVNAMSVGIVQVGHTISATAKGVGNPVFFVGSATGKDGIGGASFASANINADSVQELPAVQVGDPFQEKKLLEACLEVIATQAVVGMQDMGAAGIICSTAEMSEKGGVGMHIDLSKVPTRQANMKAWEILLSESQERMLMVVQKGKEQEVLQVFEKWDLPCSEIGHVTQDGILNFYLNGTLEASIPAAELVLGGGAPQYDRDTTIPSYIALQQAYDINNIPVPTDLISIAKQVLAIPTIASKQYIYNQYDSMVGTSNTNTNNPSAAAVVLVQGTHKALAITTDCNSRYVYANPYVGTMIAVTEAARNIVCSGGVPLGITNCLNFGNPYNPEVYYQFVQAIKGMSTAATLYQTPVTGGNVSFYNQSTDDGPVYPTPTIGMVGVLEHISNKMTTSFTQSGNMIYMLGSHHNDISSSQYLAKIIGIEHSPAPYFNINEENILLQVVQLLIQQGILDSANDVSEGGLFTTLIECCIPHSKGFEIDCATDIRLDAVLFGEAQGRYILSINPIHYEKFESITEKIPKIKLGKITDGNIKINNQFWGYIDEYTEPYLTAIGSYM